MENQNPVLEPFVSADKAANFLGVSRRHLLVMARCGLRGAYPVGTGAKRKMWVFRLSELAEGVISGGDCSGNTCSASARVSMASAVPVD